MLTKKLLLISFLISLLYMILSNLFFYKDSFRDFSEKNLAKGIKSFLIYPAKLMYGMGMIGGEFLLVIAGILFFAILWLLLLFVLYTSLQVYRTM